MALDSKREDGRAEREPGHAAADEAQVEGGVDRPAAARRSWSGLVEGVKRGDPAAMEDLYASFARGVRYYFCKHLGPTDLDDRVHDAYLTVVQAIRTGSLREPEALMGFVKTIIRRQVAVGIDEAVQLRRERADFEVGTFVSDARQNPEREAMARQRMQLMVQVLQEMPPRDSEILTRFYLHGQEQEQICREMNLTETQFRLLKSRAKARFGDLGRKRLSPAESGFEMRRLAGA